jgi:hypothetical protein
MTDSSAPYPSGPWIGFYCYRGSRERHRMDLELTFRDRLVTGSGSDDVGRFGIRGRWSDEDLRFNWIKTYPGSHDVFYTGFGESKGIWGVWEIVPWCRGGFRIWPKGQGEDLVEEVAETAEAPVEPGRRGA